MEEAWIRLEGAWIGTLSTYGTNDLADQRLRICAWDVEIDSASLCEGDAGKGESRDGCAGGEEHRDSVKIEFCVQVRVIDWKSKRQTKPKYETRERNLNESESSIIEALNKGKRREEKT